MSTSTLNSSSLTKSNSQVGLGMEKKNEESNSVDPSNERKESPGRNKLRTWLHSLMSVVLSDGRTLVGTFVCTDRDTNIILSSCTEHLPHSHTDGEEEARMLGLAMIPGRHVVSMSVDERTINQRHQQLHQHQPQEDLSQEERTPEGGVNFQPGAQMLDPPLGYT